MMASPNIFTSHIYQDYKNEITFIPLTVKNIECIQVEIFL